MRAIILTETEIGYIEEALLTLRMEVGEYECPEILESDPERYHASIDTQVAITRLLEKFETKS